MRIKNFCYGLSILIWFLSITVKAQLLPPERDEQDACKALLLCGNKFYTSHSYQGSGKVLDMYATPCNSGEANSVWLRLEVDQPGSIVFTIAPNDTTDDYDFAVLNITHLACDNIMYYSNMANVCVRCNFNNNSQPNTYYAGGIVGLNYASSLQFVTGGTNGNPFLKAIDATAGDVYLIMINNFGSGGGNLGSGFTIDLTGSTATFFGTDPPTYDTIAAVPCGSIDTFTVHFKAPVLCNSIAANGSDFQIVPTAATIVNAVGNNCSGGYGYTQNITLTLSNSIPNGVYTLQPQTGTDGNTLIGLCNSEQLLSDRISLPVVEPMLDVGPDTITCVNNLVQLQAYANSNLKIQWSPAMYLDNDTVLNPLMLAGKDITYVVNGISPNRPECIVTDTINITVLQGFRLLNEDTLICLGQTIYLITEGDNRYSYQWAPAANLPDPNNMDISVTPDITTVYQVTALYPGCKDSTLAVTVGVDIWRGITFKKDKDSICAGNVIHFIPKMDSVFGKLTWNFGDGSDKLVTICEPVSHVYTSGGAFPVQLTANFPACPDTTFIDSIYIYPAPLVNIGSDTAICFSGTTFMLTRYNNISHDETLQWSTGETTPDIFIKQEGVYWLYVANGKCGTTDSVTIFKSCQLRIPNAFTPNGDGINDYFFPRELFTSGIKEFHMQVYNRWGTLIFETNTTNGRGWDGTFNSTSQSEGVYVYVIEVSYINDVGEKYKGNVTLIR